VAGRELVKYFLYGWIIDLFTPSSDTHDTQQDGVKPSQNVKS